MGPRLSAFVLVGLLPLPRVGYNEGEDRSAAKLQPASLVSSYAALRKAGSVIACRITASYEMPLCVAPSSSSMWMLAIFEDRIITRQRACEMSMFQVPSSSLLLRVAVFDHTIIRRQVREPRREICDDTGPCPSVVLLVGC